jgi:hypothetical protein
MEERRLNSECEPRLAALGACDASPPHAPIAAMHANQGEAVPMSKTQSRDILFAAPDCAM